MSKVRVLVVDDDFYVRRLLATTLARAGYLVVEAVNAAEALAAAAAGPVDAVLLDLGLPDRDGLELVPLLARRARAPVIVVSARQDTGDKVAALDLGASDYVTKPFDSEELLARLRASLRQGAAEPGAGGTVALGAVTLDLAARTATRGGAAAHLTRKEFDVLSLLLANAGRVVTHRQLLEGVWRQDEEGRVEYLRMIVRQLRQKLEDDPARPSLIVNELGIGYRLRPPG